MRVSNIFKLGPALVALTIASGALAQQSSGLPPQAPELPDAPMVSEGTPYVVYPTRGGVYMITGPGGNVTVQVGAEGTLVVDSGEAKSAPGLLAEIRKLSKKPISLMVNTNADPEYVGGNKLLAGSGVLLEGGNTRPSVVSGTGGSAIWSHEAVLSQLTSTDMDPMGLPTITYFVAQKDLYFNGEPVQLFSAPGHQAGDSLVLFRRSDVISAGEIYSPDRYPNIEIENGGSIQAYLDSLNLLLRLTVAEFNQQGGTWVIPGHGRLSDEADVADYRDMVTFIRDRVQAMVTKKMSLAQIKAARPTLDYDTLYGNEAGDKFVDQIYRSLTQKKKGA